MAEKTPNRWAVLAAAGVINAIVGAVYIWSIFSIPLSQVHAWSPQATALAYSLYICAECCAGFVVGWLQNRVKISLLALIGACFFAVGWTLAGFVSEIVPFYLAYSLIGGAGSGFLYNIAVSTATKWFPDKRGFANGVCIGCVGLSPLVFAPLGNMLIERFGVSASFTICGIAFGIFAIIAARFIAAPAERWKPAGWSENAESGSPSTTQDAKPDQPPAQMLKSPEFYAMWLIMVIAATSGMMISGHASGIGQQLAGLTTNQAAVQVGIFAVANFTGRVAFGALSDRIGRYPTLIVVMAITAIIMTTGFGFVSDFLSLTIVLGIVGMCFGGVMTTMPALCADAFGSKYFGQNYAFIFAGYTVASVIGPMVAATILADTGAYDAAFPIAGAITCAGIVLALVAWRLAKKR